MPILNILIVCFLTLWLTSCATTPASTAPQNNTQDWGSRAHSLSEIQQWNLKALIAIRNMAKNENVTANLQWQQSARHYTILLFGPLGSGTAKLTGAPGNVKLETSDGKTFSAPTPERLLTQQTNWDLPVSNLYYWIRGLPVPNLPAEKQFDAYHHLTELQQQGWKVQFLSYTSTNQIDVPSKIFLFNPQMNVKIVIKEWNL